jgi:hypothetical protein
MKKFDYSNLQMIKSPKSLTETQIKNEPFQYNFNQNSQSESQRNISSPYKGCIGLSESKLNMDFHRYQRTKNRNLSLDNLKSINSNYYLEDQYKLKTNSPQKAQIHHPYTIQEIENEYIHDKADYYNVNQILLII